MKRTRIVTVLVFAGLFNLPYALAGIDEAKEAYQQGNYALAFDLIKEPAAAGDSKAQALLGWFYLYGKGTKENVHASAEWLRKAAEQNVKPAFHLLGELYSDNEKILYDFDKALKYYRMAVESGYDKSVLPLAFLLLSSSGRVNYQSEIIALFEQAAEAGSRSAKFQLGNIYYLDNLVRNDYSKALYWLKRAADEGDPRAHYLLAEMYLNGDGVETDNETAVDYLEFAARRGLGPAQLKLGISYIYEYGNDYDMAEAYFWLSLARRNGVQQAASAVDGAAILLPPEEKSKIDQRLQQWHPIDWDAE